MISIGQVSSVILPFSNDFATGIDGLRTQHIKDLISKCTGNIAQKLSVKKTKWLIYAT